MTSTELLIIGAGPTGIGAALRAHTRGLPYLLVEAASGPGGMSASPTDSEGFTWDLGGHVIHSHFVYFDPDHPRPLKSIPSWVRAPLQKNLDCLTAEESAELDRDRAAERPAATSLDGFFRESFGDTLTDGFFVPLNTKTFGTPPDQLEHSWTSRRSGSRSQNVPSFGSAQPTERETIPYPAGGTGALWDAIARTLDPAAQRYDTTVQHLDLDAHVATLSDGSTITYGTVISSMPLDRLLVSISDTSMRAEAARLRHSSTLLIGLGFDGPIPDQLAGKTYIYNGQPEIDWYRSTLLSNYSQRLAGEGRWSILFEFTPTTSLADALQSAEAFVRSCAGRPVEPASRWHRLLDYGYPAPFLGRDQLLHEVQGRLQAASVLSRGRFGGWRYESCNQDYAFMQGVEAVGAAVDGSPEPTYWYGADRVALGATKS